MSPRDLRASLAPLGEILPEDWEATPESVRRLLVRLLERIDKLEQEVADLQEKLGINSRNSSLPPSSDLGGRPPRSERRRQERERRRKKGGQPGHEGTTRELLAVEDVDEVIACPPSRCGCGGEVEVDPQIAPERQQVWELPEAPARVTEYQLLWGTCAECGDYVCGLAPPEAGQGMLGARAMAALTLLSGMYHLSKRAVAGVMGDLFGIPISEATVCNTEARVSAVLEPVVEEARDYVRSQPVVHADETGWRQGPKRSKAWLWAARTAMVTVFLLRPSRATAVARELLGECLGRIVISDRYSAYGWIPTKWRQACWAHLKRDAQRIADRGGGSAEIGDTLLHFIAEMFSLWHRFRNGEINRQCLRRSMRPIRAAIKDTLILGSEVSHPRTRGTCDEILKLEPALWTFLKVDGVEPTNNAAERAVRPAVLWRKSSFGTDSDTGARFVERILSVVSSCRQQNRNPLEFLQLAIIAALARTPAPSLLPAP